MKEFIVQVLRVVPYQTLDADDKKDWGHKRRHCFFYTAENEEKALDEFHATQAISCLDHFEIFCEEL